MKLKFMFWVVGILEFGRNGTDDLGTDLDPKPF